MKEKKRKKRAGALIRFDGASSAFFSPTPPSTPSCLAALSDSKHASTRRGDARERTERVLVLERTGAGCHFGSETKTRDEGRKKIEKEKRERVVVDVERK